MITTEMLAALAAMDRSLGETIDPEDSVALMFRATMHLISARREYQVRLTTGQILQFSGMEELHKFAVENAERLEKISFWGPDGTRLRMLCRSPGNYAFTFWDSAHNTYNEVEEL